MCVYSKSSWNPIQPRAAGTKDRGLGVKATLLQTPDIRVGWGRSTRGLCTSRQDSINYYYDCYQGYRSVLSRRRLQREERQQDAEILGGRRRCADGKTRVRTGHRGKTENRYATRGWISRHPENDRALFDGQGRQFRRLQVVSGVVGENAFSRRPTAFMRSHSRAPHRNQGSRFTAPEKQNWNTAAECTRQSIVRYEIAREVISYCCVATRLLTWSVSIFDVRVAQYRSRVHEHTVREYSQTIRERCTNDSQTIHKRLLQWLLSSAKKRKRSRGRGYRDGTARTHNGNSGRTPASCWPVARRWWRWWLRRRRRQRRRCRGASP